ncbi:MAG: prepilin peptidase [Actinobacteria bacterium]|nr:prepilin peptidase [Actinomycetota bacterium]
MPDLLVLSGCLLLGLVFGSFANVVIARVPAGGSLHTPPSTCPRCAAPIRPYDNIPVVSWLLLRARCRSCEASISVEYPLVEIACALLFAAIGWRIGLSWALPGFLLFGWLLLVVAVIDVHTRRIPNRLTYPLTPTLLVLLVGAALLEGTPGVALRSLLGGLVAFALLLVLALINPRGMGMGDVKLAAFIGIGLGYLGWGHLWLGLFTGFLGGGVIAGLLVVLRLRSRKDHIPFGPWLSLGALVALLVGQPLIATYLRWAGWT